MTVEEYFANQEKKETLLLTIGERLKDLDPNKRKAIARYGIGTEAVMSRDEYVNLIELGMTLEELTNVFAGVTIR